MQRFRNQVKCEGFWFQRENEQLLNKIKVPIPEQGEQQITFTQFKRV